MRSLRLLRRAFFVVVVALLAIVGASRDATAQAQAPGKEYAKKLFEEGVELEKKGDYAGALAKYYEAEPITVTAGLRFHEAYCLEMTNKLTSAADAYESAIKIARDQSKGDLEKTAQARLDALKPRVPTLAVRFARPTEVEVRLDGAFLAPLLLDGKPFRVDPGDHTVTAQAQGFAPFTKTVRIDERSAIAIEIVLEKSAGAAKVPSKAPPQSGGETKVAFSDEPPPVTTTKRSRLVPIAATAGAVVFLAGGVVAYVLAGSAQSDAQTSCPTKTSCDDERSKVRTLDAIALGSFLGAAGLGAIAIVTWSSASSSASAPRARARVVASPSRLGLEGSF